MTNVLLSAQAHYESSTRITITYITTCVTSMEPLRGFLQKQSLKPRRG